MRPGRRGIDTGIRGRRDGLRSRSGARLAVAVIVVLGVLSWAVVPAFSLSVSIDSDTGSQVCRMACADTAHCCCKPSASARETNHRQSPGPGLSSLETRESCPRDCATLTVVPGTTTARSAIGVHRLTAPGAGQMHYGHELHAATQHELYDVARPRGPPTEARNDRSIARASSDTPSVFASLRSGFPRTARSIPGSSESRHSSAWRPDNQSINGLEPRGYFRQQNSHPVVKRSLTGVDAHHHGGTHE